MKILEAQTAVLTNYEVYQFLNERKLGQKSQKKRGDRRAPGNLETLAKELMQYFRSPPSPLSQNPITYRPDSIARLLERLRPYDLAKAEVVMMINLRPASVAALNTVIEDMTERFDETQQEEIVNVIAEVLGAFPQEAEQQEDGEQANGEA
ncbi:DNA-directed RNA polymerase III subunit RPC9 [Colletotrichum sidae]|uniref:DNA-directed RNA polymerase III subunit RPC9 n=2 Tax=Colletotrichum orbiculare species complex TaxID=2707354 RepID=A0A4R8RRR9_COLTR|nr:DNA-directed RNA polymerase III subunit RPC9 [Colletotrichum trifolii]TEA17521.1 DNA-directed RNA polymerase III subunit RPC9 [Colletotrichum sidae]